MSKKVDLTSRKIVDKLVMIALPIMCTSFIQIGYSLIDMIWGSLTTFILVFLGEYIFRAFINESEAILKGTDYLKILWYSQLFICLEITVAGIFKEIGRTYISSIIIDILTGLRIPLVLILSKTNILGLNGVWWIITISSIAKGIVLVTILVVLRKNHKLYMIDNEEIENIETKKY